MNYKDRIDVRIACAHGINLANNELERTTKNYHNQRADVRGYRYEYRKAIISGKVRHYDNAWILAISENTLRTCGRLIEQDKERIAIIKKGYDLMNEYEHKKAGNVSVGWSK